MRYVYLLESKAVVGQRYIGATSDLRKRLADPNSGKSAQTSKYAPWRLATYVAFLRWPKSFRALPEIRIGTRLCQEAVVVARLLRAFCAHY